MSRESKFKISSKRPSVKEFEFQVVSKRLQEFGMIKLSEENITYSKRGDNLGGKQFIELTDSFGKFMEQKFMDGIANNTITTNNAGAMIINEQYFVKLEEIIKEWCGSKLEDIDDMYYMTSIIDKTWRS